MVNKLRNYWSENVAIIEMHGTTTQNKVSLFMQVFF
jgi:hypothetical protein